MMGKLSERRIGGLLAAGLLLGGLALGLFFSPGEGYAFPEPLETTDVGTTDLSGQAIVADETFLSDKDNPTGRTNFRDKTLTVDESFTSNLPLVVLDTGEQEPRRNSYYDHDRGYYVPLDIDPYAYGTFSLLDRENGVNRLSDVPVLTSSGSGATPRETMISGSISSASQTKTGAASVRSFWVWAPTATGF